MSIITPNDSLRDKARNLRGNKKKHPLYKKIIKRTYKLKAHDEENVCGIGDKVKVMEKSCLTEISELQCSIGGKIKVMNHGQTAEVSKQNLKNADPFILSQINPFFNFGEFLDEIEEEENSFDFQ